MLAVTHQVKSARFDTTMDCVSTRENGSPQEFRVPVLELMSATIGYIASGCGRVHLVEAPVHRLGFRCGCVSVFLIAVCCPCV